VLVSDWPHWGVGTAIPYGTYDVQQHHGLVNEGMTHDTAAFAVESIRRWWHQLGRQPAACEQAVDLCGRWGQSWPSPSRVEVVWATRGRRSGVSCDDLS
jgi:DDE family transposase